MKEPTMQDILSMSREELLDLLVVRRGRTVAEIMGPLERTEVWARLSQKQKAEIRNTIVVPAIDRAYDLARDMLKVQRVDQRQSQQLLATVMAVHGMLGDLEALVEERRQQVA